ncbi:MAG TPA: 4-(cytidine 5'-diphospho)-2-C-methyl-D-erythritol kinase [Pyrinomonadaceae bacterium]|nr:4-(cytidine 5'-diphospho)-2-C-methyl-D-erythritol kinase [Pyrinomonadaceae bacterium]
MNSTVTVPSFAKINWHLQILGKRNDGYHELRTILQTITLHDVLHFDRRADGAITLECSDESIPTDSSNLIVRAANALRKRCGVSAGAHIVLEKKIPANAGLGGGSSNAAVSLLALAFLWKIEIDQPSLLKTATELGADVPFFLLGGMALAEGTGTTLSALPDPASQHLIIIKPKAGVSTADAYASLNSGALTTLSTDPILSSSPTPPHFSDLEPAVTLKDLRNDFESVIFDMEPEIRRSKEALLQAGAREALLAGSGASVFGVFPDQRDRQLGIEKIQTEAGWRVFACDTLSRNEYIRALTVNDVSLIR